MSYTISKLRRAETFEYEDSRVSNRLATAMRVLEAAGAKPTVTYGDRKVWDWATNMERVDDSPRNKTVTWEPWVSDDMLSDAYALASKVIGARGDYIANEATRAKDATNLAKRTALSA